ncbi:hypothetical protein [Mycolicibacterium aubagnense]|uniref:Uncharacterized protein n=1 Tax=Mycolicibacterium aubagnense TaxID=319707 RepID=A0ABM8HME8_9MYCO|nr:hypothetical protein [Mycolicibacterium aubagnense]TLH60116.1 hypothetical protein C1S80_17570 [Mycolicibacterium aubagnense]WGI34826.1 hypothetical protein QDT91_11015 [Mycolicibacterium aubagnense]BBX83276.1 hypothetical protein MAUB_11490 [Mycolicibacterium aubagnense]
MVTVLVADCAGLWRRTLLIEADGARDEKPGVRWLQGPSAYVDSRGFAGTLAQHGDVFEWHRAVDVQPPGPFPDAGEMRWEGDVLVETGVHENYVEHWVRDPDDAGPTGALFLSGPDGASALLVRAGSLFGWAGCGQVLIGTVGDAEYQTLRIIFSGNEIQANDVRWTVAESEGNVDSWVA